MDINNPVIKLCIDGTQAEFAGQPDKAKSLYEQAWVLAQDDYESCIAAHYVARLQDDGRERLRWNRIALQCAQAVQDNRVDEFYPSLYLNMGSSYEQLGDVSEAKRYYDLAAALGVVHQVDEH
jgi:tetratricopeptide (TPR) repeat protein